MGQKGPTSDPPNWRPAAPVPFHTELVVSNDKEPIG